MYEFYVFLCPMQPERILGDEYSIRSELWSLGVSLLEVIKKAPKHQWYRIKGITILPKPFNSTLHFLTSNGTI